MLVWDAGVQALSEMPAAEHRGWLCAGKVSMKTAQKQGNSALRGVRALRQELKYHKRRVENGRALQLLSFK